MSKDSTLTLENLTVSYNEKIVLDNLSLSTSKGEMCCVIGEEGSGKSTLLKAIAQQLPYKGLIKHNDQILNKTRAELVTKCGIDFIVQGGNILKSFTVEEHIKLALSNSKMRNSNARMSDIEFAFPTIMNLSKQIAGNLSGGERMLVSLSCLLATDADVWILDEPTAGLAPEICLAIKDFLLRMKHERQKTILLLEHNYDFSFAISDTVIALKDKKLSRKFTPEEFRHDRFIDSVLYESVEFTTLST